MADVNISKYRASVVRDGSKPASPGFVVSEGQDPVNPPGTNNFVPYTGATANVELGEFGLETGFVTLDTTPTNIPTEQGAIYWDDTRSTVALIMNGTLQHIGQDSFYYVKNSSGSTIPKGTAVRFAGTNGASGHVLIEPFLANGTYPSFYFMGVTAEAITNGSFGQVMHFGELEGINTSGYTAGALLYASTTVPGGFQTTAPVAPNNIILVAAAVNSKNNGAIVVRPTYGSNINTDEGVKITSGTTGDLLQLQAGGLWENKTLAQVIGSAYVPSTRTITINGTTQDLSANRTFNVGTVTSVGLSSATSGVSIGSTPVTSSGTITLAIATASGSQNGLLSSTDWTTFNNKQNALTNPVTGTGAQGRVAYWDSTGVIKSDSLFQWNDFSKRLGIGRTPTVSLDVEGAGFFSGTVTASSIIKSGGTSSQYLMADGSVSTLTNPVTGTGTTNYLPKFTGSTTIGNSALYDGGGFGGFNSTGLGVRTFVVQAASSRPLVLELVENSGVHSVYIRPNVSGYNLITSNYNGGGVYLPLSLSARENSSDLVLHTSGNVSIGTTTDNGARLQVSGVTRINAGSLSGSFGLNIDVNSTFAFGSTNGRRTGTITRDSGDKPGLQFGYDATDNTGIIAGATESLGAGLDFYTYNGSSWGNRMRITSSGNVLIGTTTDAGFKLRVQNGQTYFVGSGSSSSTYSLIIQDSGNNNQFLVRDDGLISFPKTASLWTTGNAANAWINPSGGDLYRSTSSIKYKKNVQNYDKGLKEVLNLRPVTYQGLGKIDSNKTFAGLIAEEVHELGLSEFVQYAEDGSPDALGYQNMIALLTKAIQELKQEIDTLKN